jgi:hypothetical protein
MIRDVVFRDMASCGSSKSRHFGETNMFLWNAVFLTRAKLATDFAWATFLTHLKHESLIAPHNWQDKSMTWFFIKRCETANSSLDEVSNTEDKAESLIIALNLQKPQKYTIASYFKSEPHTMPHKLVRWPLRWHWDRNTWRMVSSGMLHCVALVRPDVSEEPSAFFIRVTRIGELGTTLAVTSNRRTLVFFLSVRRLLVTSSAVPSLSILVTLMKEALGSFETSVLTRTTQRNTPEDTILNSHRRENFKSYRNTWRTYMQILNIFCYKL